jgi:hypothetical protein
MATRRITSSLAAGFWFLGGAILAAPQEPPPPASPAPAAGVEQSASSAPAPETHSHGDAEAQDRSSRNLFQSDMTLMTGMTPRDPMGGMSMPGWHIMDMGVVKLIYNRQGGPSGKQDFESLNWNMLHAEHDLWGGRFSLMLMNSLEPATMPRRGSAQLFQEGETLDRQPLVDTQHPHDFFMNLSATYRHSLGDEGAYWVQYAPVGEPALGPTAFMHRASSGENPTAPLGHHGQDSTHITFGVATVGVGWRWISIEGSAFRGAEPDENRWNFESGKLDSASGRIKLYLPHGWSGQVSFGSIRDPELLFPGVIHRTTASIHYGAEGDRPLAVSLIYGRDHDAGRGLPSIAISTSPEPLSLSPVPLALEHPNAPRGFTEYWLIEGAYQITPKDQVYGRGEYVDRNLQLLVTKRNPLPGQPVGVSIVRIKALTIGYFRDFDIVRGLKTGIGADLTGYIYPDYMDFIYGGHPLSTHVFFRFRWGKPHGMDHMM